jgi:hypothetical protein
MRRFTLLFFSYLGGVPWASLVAPGCAPMQATVYRAELIVSNSNVDLTLETVQITDKNVTA